MDAGEIERVAKGLPAAQARYLRALAPNHSPGYPQFGRYAFAKELRRPGLDTAWSLIRKGIVAVAPEPCECGQHYASLTPLGIAVRKYLETHHD